MWSTVNDITRKPGWIYFRMIGVFLFTTFAILALGTEVSDVANGYFNLPITSNIGLVIVVFTLMIAIVVNNVFTSPTSDGQINILEPTKSHFIFLIMVLICSFSACFTIFLIFTFLGSLEKLPGIIKAFGVIIIILEALYTSLLDASRTISQKNH